MSKADILSQLVALETIIAKNDGFVTEEAERIRIELNVPSVDSLRAHLSTLAEEQRLLNIGVIGRVKAGKSSLLNSVLFDGQDILPKAATPMTASLVIITYGNEFAATVEYFTPDDITRIEQDHRGYTVELEKEFQTLKSELEKAQAARPSATVAKAAESIEDKAKRQANRALKEHHHAAAFDQFERMKRSGKLQEMRERNAPQQRITATNQEELKGKLSSYVGSEGVLMPFTKSVRLELPLESLRNIQVVDTPGINDPVVSREQRTQEYLKKCDVVLIVSPSGQFLSREDTDLMDRVTAREGVREMYIVAAQADTQLHGDILDKCGKDLPQAMHMLRSQLGEQAATTLETLKRNSPEIGRTYDQLIEGGVKRVIVASSICHAMLLRYDQRTSWDEGMNHVWGLLTHNYPDHFGSDGSAREALRLLASIDAVQTGIEVARQSKDAIMEQKRIDYLAGQTKTVQDFRNRLAEGIKAQIDTVQNSDLKTVQEQKKAAEKMIRDGSDAVDDAFEESLNTFKAELRETVMSKAKNLFAETQSGSKDAVSTTTEERTGSRKKGGNWNGFKNWLNDDWGREAYSYSVEVTTIRASAVTSMINKLVDDLQDDLSRAVNEAKSEWKQKVQRQVAGELQKAVEDAGQFFAMLKKALRGSINNMQLPNITIDFPFDSKKSGVLKGGEAEKFIEKTEVYLDELRAHYRTQTTKLIDDLARAASRKKMSDLIFSDLIAQLKTLEAALNDKTFTLDRLNRCLTELNKPGASA